MTTSITTGSILCFNGYKVKVTGKVKGLIGIIHLEGFAKGARQEVVAALLSPIASLFTVLA